MNRAKTGILDELVRAGSLLSQELNFKSLIAVLVEQTIDISLSDVACLYLKNDPAEKRSDLKLAYRRGRMEAPATLSHSLELVCFIEDSREAVVLVEKKPTPFKDIFLDPRAGSAIALPLVTPKANLGILILNSRQELFYNREKFNFLDSFTKLAGGMLHNSKMFFEMKEYLRKIEELERYQTNIFSSMTNLLITTDKMGQVKYFNTAAEKSIGLVDNDIGKDLNSLFKNRIGKKILSTIETVRKEKSELLGVEGILKKKGDRDIDFSLNISPLHTRRGHFEGVTLLFTDQSRERELQQKMSKVIEERRLIKDMFSRYLSTELVQQLVDQPELVRPFGDKKEATIFFADIRGYTSFSEGKDPEYIIEILNEYFNDAVEIVIKHNGFIDKFIGDCIMAAWGVPLQTIEQDARNAVSSALEIQNLVASADRHFFKGKAKGLKVGIGMHTGPLVAGNLGSSRRMDYTVIGDTVNIAARLEGVAGPGEIIITEDTRRHLNGAFKIKKREPVRVKGKKQPIPIFAVS